METLRKEMDEPGAVSMLVVGAESGLVCILEPSGTTTLATCELPSAPVPCYAMLCYAMPCYAMPCYAMLCYAMLCYA